MDHQELRRRFATLTTAHLADACLKAQVPVRCAPASLSTVMPGSRLAGRVAPAQHVGSVDIFLEALERAAPGEVLVVDNGGRLDEACVGDLVALEAQAAGLEGLVIWGLHRDTADLRPIGLPVFSLGAIPTGPQRLDARPTMRWSPPQWELGRWVGRTWSWAMTMASSLYQPPARWTSSGLQRRSATPNDAKPNGFGQASPCAVSCSSTATLRSAKRRLP
jgi:hypothetical protein